MACGVVYIFWVNKAFTGMARLPMLRKVGPLGHGLKWNGATWLFAGTANRDRFKVSPKKFMRQYGGYCAWAAS